MEFQHSKGGNKLFPLGGLQSSKFRDLILSQGYFDIFAHNVLNISAT